MEISLLTDAPRHNLALMKISAYHKQRGDQVHLNMPLIRAGKSYGSWLFSCQYNADVQGGPAYDPTIRLNGFNGIKPDYDLFSVDFSLGYTWAYCPRRCPFCIVPKQNNPKVHHSIWEFHDSRFSKICLLNNNTFSDPAWRETFEEIWDASLTMVDENGYDLRLLDEEKLEILNRTAFERTIYFAWDRIEDEPQILNGLKVLRGIRHPVRIYVLVGFPDYRPIDETDIHRCQVIADYGFDPFIMIFNNSHKRQLRQFRWLANRTFSWRRLGFREMWQQGYKRNMRIGYGV